MCSSRCFDRRRQLEVTLGDNRLVAPRPAPLAAGGLHEVPPQRPKPNEPGDPNHPVPRLLWRTESWAVSRGDPADGPPVPGVSQVRGAPDRPGRSETTPAQPLGRVRVVDVDLAGSEAQPASDLREPALAERDPGCRGDFVVEPRRDAQIASLEASLRGRQMTSLASEPCVRIQVHVAQQSDLDREIGRDLGERAGEVEREEEDVAVDRPSENRGRPRQQPAQAFTTEYLCRG